MSRQLWGFLYRCRLFSSHLEKQNNKYTLWKSVAFADSCGEHLWEERVAWRCPHLLHQYSAAWLRSSAPRFEEWDPQWEQCGAQLCLQDFRDDIITPEAEQSGAPGRQRDVSSATHQGQLIQHQHWAHCGLVQCTTLSFFCGYFFFQNYCLRSNKNSPVAQRRVLWEPERSHPIR